MSERITYSDKDAGSSNELEKKYFDSDANQVKETVNAHADEIEELQAALPTSTNPFYGTFTSLTNLVLAYPTGELNSWAIIDAGFGLTPKIALWDNTDGQWEISTATQNIITVENYAALPSTGVADTIYITIDTFQCYFWASAQYNLLSPVNNSDFNRFTIRNVQTSYTDPEISTGTVDVQYSSGTDKVTHFIFDGNYTNFLKGFEALFPDQYKYVIKVYNLTRHKTYVTKVSGFELVSSDSFYKMAIENTVDVSDLDTGDRVVVHISAYEPPVDGAGDMSSSIYDPAGKEEQVLTLSDILDEDDMASDSETKTASQQSIKAFVLNKVASTVKLQGGYDASTNTPNLTTPFGVKYGDQYIVTVAGTFFGANVEVGDSLISLADDPSTLANWMLLQTNLDAAGIKTLYESNSDTNALTDALLAKLSAIRTRTIYTNATATGTLNLDLSTYVRFDLTVTGNLTIGFSALSLDADMEGINIHNPDGYTVDFVSEFLPNDGSEDFDFTLWEDCHVALNVKNIGSGTELIYYGTQGEKLN